jgi:hypothetical protein
MQAVVMRDETDDREQLPQARALAPSRQQEWEQLNERERALLTPAVIRRWTDGLTEDDYTLQQVAALERRRLNTLRTLRDGAELTDQEFKLLRHLQRHATKTRSYLQIAQYLWGTRDRPITAAMLAGHHGYQSPWVAHIHQLVGQIRRKLEVDPARPQHLATIRAVGYVWYWAGPALDDGIDYEARNREAVVQRYELRRDFGLVFDDEELPPGARPQVQLGPEHPDYAPGLTIEGTTIGRGESRPADEE